MPRKLTVLAGPDEGRVFPIDSGTFLVGRSRATATALIDPHVARVHCQILLEDGQYVLTDFDSASGTAVNGKAIDRHVLQPGDLIRIGQTVLQFAEADRETDPVPGGRKRQWAEELVGQKLGHYRVGSLLARGRSGYVFHGRDSRRNLPVVLKVFERDFLRREGGAEKFVADMKSTLPLRHPNLVKVYGAGRTGDHCWIAKEYVAGESLSALIARIAEVDVGRIDWRNAVRVGVCLARALAYAHGKDLVHGNVTPPNVLLGKTPHETKVADLMVARAVDDDPLRPVSASGTPCETLSYQPAERTRPGTPTSPAADVYGLGAVLFAMLTGSPPHRAATVDELVGAIRHETPTLPDSIMMSTPPTFHAYVFRLLAKDPGERFPTAKEAFVPLLKFAQDEGIAV